jgi:hypothetical protein
MSAASLRLPLSIVVLSCFAILVACPPSTDPKAQILPIEAQDLGLDANYQLSPYPVDNFGLLTSYRPPKGQKWNEGNQICATWSCLGLDSIPTDATQRFTVNGFADSGTGGTLTLSDDKQNSFGINLLLPGLAKLIDVKGNVDWKKHITVKLQLGPATKRILNRIKAQNYFDNVLKPGNPLKDAYDKKELVIIVADVITDSLDATITVDKDLNVGASAALSKAAQSQALPVGKDSSLSGKLENKGNGTYHLEVKNPVVLAVFPRELRKTGNLGKPQADWSDWDAVHQTLTRNLK